jgi:hypothetical protein
MSLVGDKITISVPQHARRSRVEVNGIAHIQISVNRFDECKAFYDRLMPYLGLQMVYSAQGFVYYVGGKTGYAVSKADEEYASERHVPTRASPSCLLSCPKPRGHR